MRVAMTLSYDGTPYFGSQIQKETRHTILGQLSKVFLQLGIEGNIIASGRTDKGVHATGQVIHIDLPSFWGDMIKLKKVLNQMLSKSIHIKKISQVSDDFHARYSAKKRTYRYVIKVADSNPFQEQYVTFVNTLALETLQDKMKLFIGEHDFKNFIKSGSDEKSTKRFIYKSFAYKHKGYIILNFQANGFLRSQIRMMVSSLLELNSNKLQEKLDNKINHKVKPAPANGLYLTKINY